MDGSSEPNLISPTAMSRPLHRSGARLAIVLAIAPCAYGCSASTENHGPDSTIAELSFCAEEAPVWFAAQDGDGPWTRLAPVSGGVYEITLTTGRGAVAYVKPNGQGLVVYYGVAAELGTVQCRKGGRTISGTVRNASYAGVWLGHATGETDDDVLTIDRASSEPQDLFAGSYQLMPDAEGYDRIILRRDQDVPSGQLALLDFASEEAFAPAVVTVGTTGLGSMTSNLRSVYMGNQGSLSVWLSYRTGVSDDPVPLQLIPAAQLRPGELSAVHLIAFDGMTSRETVTFVSNAADMALAPGPLLNIPEVTLDATATAVYPHAVLTSQTEYSRLASAQFRQSAAGAVVTITSGYLGGIPQQWDIRVPDLSSVHGWSDGWNLDPLQEIEWAVSAAGGVNLSLGDAVQAGDEYQRATAYSQASSESRFSLDAAGDTPRSWGFPSIPTRPVH